MKWIGQHIYDLIARFRSDVYLEDISDHGSDPDRFLTMDSSTGKITYRTGSEVLSDIGASSTEGDITSVTAGTNLSGGGATGDVTINLADASTSAKGAASFNSNYFTTSSGAVSLATAMTWADTTITTDSLTLTSANADDPVFTIKNTTGSNTQACRFVMTKDKGAGASGDNVGEIEFYSKDASNNDQMYSKILSEIDVATHGQESGKLSLRVASHDGGQNDGLVLTGGSVDQEVDVTIGNGADSITTISGDLNIAPTGAVIRAGIPNIYGNTIKLLPSDFVTNDDGGATKFGIGYVDHAGTSYGMKPTNAATELYAFVSIPEGMKATHVDIYDKTDLDIEVFEIQINATTMTSKGTGTCNTTLDITDVSSTATNMLAIHVTTTATSDRVYGGTVTIATQ